MAKKLWRRLPKYVLIFTIILSGFLEIQVKAATCSNGTNNQAYYNNGTWTSILAVNNEQDIPTSSTRLLIAQTNSNIKNSNLSYTIRTEMKAVGNFQTNPTIEVRYGTSSTYINIASQCSIRWNRSYEYNDSIVTKTIWNNEIVCNYQGANTNANYIGIVYEISNQPINKIRMTSRCLVINPNETDQIISNDNNNTNEIRSDMYEYYDSLWEKSNVQEQNILDAIEEATEVTEEAEELESTESWEDVNEDLDDLMNQQDINGLNVLQITAETTGAQYLWWLTERMINDHALVVINTTIGTCLLFGILKMIFRR